MRLGAAVISPQRMQVRRLAVFAEWSDEAALEKFLGHHPLGRRLGAGWHVRLEFLRRWGSVREFAGLENSEAPADPQEPVVAVTLARMRLLEVPRFIRWGRPVEKQVRDHPGDDARRGGDPMAADRLDVLDLDEHPGDDGNGLRSRRG